MLTQWASGLPNAQPRRSVARGSHSLIAIPLFSYDITPQSIQPLCSLQVGTLYILRSYFGEA